MISTSSLGQLQQLQCNAQTRSACEGQLDVTPCGDDSARLIQPVMSTTLYQKAGINSVLIVVQPSRASASMESDFHEFRES